MAHRVLVSGGAGFIGCVVAKRLQAVGAEVSVMDNLHPQVHGDGGVPASLSAARFFGGDVAHLSNWHTVLRTTRPTIIVHLAAETGTGQSLTEAHRHASVNVAGTAAMLDALTSTNHKPQRLLVASSRAVYGDGAWASTSGVFYPRGRTLAQLKARQWDITSPEGGAARALPHDAEATHTNPISVYGVTKLAQEQMMACWAEAFDVPLTILRLQNVYGPGQAIGNPYTGVLTAFARAVLSGQSINVYEDGAIIRDFVHVDDVASAMVSAIQIELAGVRRFDIGSGSPTTIGEVATLMSQLAKSGAPNISGQYRAGDVRAASCTIARAASDLRYAPSVPLQTGLSQLLDFVQRNS